MLQKLKNLLTKYKSRLKLAGVFLVLLLLSKGLQSFARANYDQGRTKGCNNVASLFIPPTAGAFCKVDEKRRLVMVISAMGRTFNVETGEEFFE